MIFLGVIFINTTYAQEVDSSIYFNPIKDNISQKIPPLEALIDSAIANSPNVKWEELKAARAFYDIKTERRAWTEHIGVDLLINYGTYYFNDRNELTPELGFYLLESRRITYSGGVYVRFPLYYIIDRKNNINKKKKELEIAMIQRDVRIREIRKEVIETYNELMQQQLMLKIQNDYQQTSDMMMQNAENMFLAGEIPPEEYNRQKDYATRGAASYYETLGRFNIAYTLLEELVGFKFNLINVLK